MLISLLIARNGLSGTTTYVADASRGGAGARAGMPVQPDMHAQLVARGGLAREEGGAPQEVAGLPGQE